MTLSGIWIAMATIEEQQDPTVLKEMIHKLVAMVKAEKGRAEAEKGRAETAEARAEVAEERMRKRQKRTDEK